MLHSYSSPYNYGHKALDGLFDGNPVIVQEKVDGSQFSFGMRNGELFCRSRRVALVLDDAGMFQKAVDAVKELAAEKLLIDGWTYRGEFLGREKHNTLKYGRVPKRNIILYDIDKGDQDYMFPPELMETCWFVQMEAVPLLGVYVDKPPLEELRKLLDGESILGGCNIEGIVLKNYALFEEGSRKVLMAKLVSDDFKEVHSGDWKKRNPSQNDFVEDLACQYATEARWQKAIQHLGEQELLKYAPQDIPDYMREIVRDFEDECKAEVAEKLYEHFQKKFRKAVTSGAPEYYKRWLAERSE